LFQAYAPHYFLLTACPYKLVGPRILSHHKTNIKQARLGAFGIGEGPRRDAEQLGLQQGVEDGRCGG
jgi:hypothetical protein